MNEKNFELNMVLSVFAFFQFNLILDLFQSLLWWRLIVSLQFMIIFFFVLLKLGIYWFFYSSITFKIEIEIKIIKKLFAKKKKTWLFQSKLLELNVWILSLTSFYLLIYSSKLIVDFLGVVSSYFFLFLNYCFVIFNSNIYCFLFILIIIGLKWEWKINK